MTDKSYRGGQIPLPTAPVITFGSRHSLGATIRCTGIATPASGANPFAANDMLAFPFVLNDPTSINKVFWVNGSTASSNCSVAIYDADYVKLGETASTAQSGASVPQSVSLARKLNPGLYYLALAHDSATTNRLFRWSINTHGAGMWKMAGCWRQASVTLGTLPNPAVPVACNNIAFPVFGLITRTVFDV